MCLLPNWVVAVRDARHQLIPEELGNKNPQITKFTKVLKITKYELYNLYILQNRHCFLNIFVFFFETFQKVSNSSKVL